MSIVLPSSENNLKRASSTRFAPSKCLLEAKEKLGPIYYNSRLVECPQNAIEISKLLHTYSEIDKKSFQVKEENRRQQRQLIHNLESRYSFTRRVSLQDQKVSDIKLPPTGFRYHSDGTPKLVRVPMATDFRDSEDRQYFNDSDSDVEASDNIYTSGYNLQSESNSSSPREKTKDGKNLVKISEKLITKIKKELELNEADIARHKKFFNSKPDNTKPRVSFQLSTKAVSQGNIKRKPSVDIDKSSIDSRRHSFSNFEKKNDGILTLNRVNSRGNNECHTTFKENATKEPSGQPQILIRRTSVPITSWKYSTHANSLQSKHYSLVTLKSNRKPSVYSSPLLLLKDKKSTTTQPERKASKTGKETYSPTNEQDGSITNLRLRRLASAIPIRTTESVKLLGRCSSANILKRIQVYYSIYFELLVSMVEKTDMVKRNKWTSQVQS